MLIRKMIYFIQMGDDGPIKIGTTEHIHERMEKLQVANPYKLKILWVYNGRSYDEAGLHKKYDMYNIRGEWFWPVKEILEFRSTHCTDCYSAIGVELARCWEDMDMINFNNCYGSRGEGYNYQI